MIAVAPSGLNYSAWLTQGSQSLALGLTLIAAPQLAEYYVSVRGFIKFGTAEIWNDESQNADLTTLFCAYSSRDGFVRSRLICERRDFSSSVRFFALRGLRVGTRLAGR